MATAEAKRIGDATNGWGYKFGVDGTLTEKQVSDLLGGLTRNTIIERSAQGKFRRGKDERRVVYCKRSVMDYIASLEQ